MSDLLHYGLSNAVVAAVLAVLAGALSLPLRRRPAVVHALWLIVLLKLLTPPLWKLHVPWPPPAPVPAARPAPAEVDDSVPDGAWVEVPSIDLVAPAREQHTPRTVAVAPAAGAALWASGTFFCLIVCVLRAVRFRGLLRSAVPVPADVRLRVDRVARAVGLRAAPPAEFVPGRLCPMLWAAGRARLLLPRGLWDRLDDAQRDTLVAHELAHLRRRDHWVRWAEVLATALYWWNPVVWLARRRLREAEEQCCDAWVVWSIPGAAVHYMKAIVEAVEFVSQGDRAGSPARPAVPALASGMGEFRRLQRRLLMIRQSESPRRLGRLGLLSLSAVAAVALPLAPSMAQQETRTVVVKPAGPTTSGEADYRVVTADEATAFSPDGKTVVVRKENVVTQLDAGSGKIMSRTQLDGKGADDAELQQARAEVEKLSAELQVARTRLKQLEMGRARGQTFSYKVAPGEANNALPDKVKEFKAKKDKDSNGGQDRRIDQLEKKLERIDQMLNEMRDLQKQEYKRKNASDGPATSSLPLGERF